jgi:hypothetical protein
VVLIVKRLATAGARQEELLVDEGSTRFRSETKIRFSPVLLSREATKLAPAGNGRNVRVIPADATKGSGNGTEIAVELTGIIDKKEGVDLEPSFGPAKEMVKGVHSSTSAVKLNLRP